MTIKNNQDFEGKINENSQRISPRMNSHLGGNERVLLVEDEIDILESIAILLESQGYQIDCAQDGEEAMRILNAFQEDIDLVVTDVAMPRLDGQELIVQIRALVPDIPIIISTEFTSNDKILSFLKGNDLPVLEKPFSPQELFSKVRDSLDSPMERSRNQ